jgi:hypothetical protein
MVTPRLRRVCVMHFTKAQGNVARAPIRCRATAARRNPPLLVRQQAPLLHRTACNSATACNSSLNPTRIARTRQHTARADRGFSGESTVEVARLLTLAPRLTTMAQGNTQIVCLCAKSRLSAPQQSGNLFDRQLLTRISFQRSQIVLCPLFASTPRPLGHHHTLIVSIVA